MLHITVKKRQYIEYAFKWQTLIFQSMLKTVPYVLCRGKIGHTGQKKRCTK